ncbi:conserved hypothetical protein [Talaromyces stipitatus ATCC 10500]|uniref:Uncharacterized protein n=1 Tax=Talaromyces stipitatus (strain ATCC 10500 / CBS 375.48 / QM 6759 / NRRL 1006) TaxID=441959 RepID=B8M5U5_TALSN|nr:uncharacterized protein TSTA_033190 [Talaromyces stipitatus ATCC 10500]EED20072.1 conserved hypothetical protein [Talaromyces stipitatus ATCC 10500]
MVSRLLRKRLVAVGMAYGFFYEGAFYPLLYYASIYFQVVVGVHNLPLLINCGIDSGLSGIPVSVYRHYVPLMLWASAGGCIGSGLIYTLNATSPAAAWVYYQVLAGLAYGSGLLLAIIAAQGKVSARRTCFNYSYAVISSTSLGAGQSVLSNLLLSKLPSTAPGVNPLSVLATGAMEIRHVFSADAVPSIVQGYLYCLRAVFLIVTAYAGIVVFFAVANR